MMRSDKIKFRVFSIFTIIVLCIGFTIKELQNDTFYMIKLGDYIFHNGIDLKEHWCWVSSLSYTYPHWLYDVFLYLIYDTFGFLGIYISTIVIFVSLILLVYFINLRFNKNEFLSFLISVISVFGLVAFATARSQLFSYIIFILEVYFIERLIDTGNKRYVIYLLLLSLLLANVHATVWVFYFILFLPFIGDYIVYLLVNKFNIGVSDKFIIEKINNFKLLFVSFILSFFMGIFSPSRICYTYVFRIMLGDTQSYILEHSPLVVIEQPLFLGIMLVLFILAYAGAKIKFKELFMILGLIFMSLVNQRNVSLLYLIGFIYIAVICIRFLNEKNDNTLNILVKLVIRNRFIYVALFLFVGFMGYINFCDKYNDSYVNEEEYPVFAVKYIKENIDLDNFRVYNGYNYGSYMLFKDLPVFVDSRSDLYLEQFNKNINIFNDWISVNFEGEYREIFNKYDINYALINKDIYIYKLFILDECFEVVYEDKYFVLFEYNDN